MRAFPGEEDATGKHLKIGLRPIFLPPCLSLAGNRQVVCRSLANTLIIIHIENTGFWLVNSKSRDTILSSDWSSHASSGRRNVTKNLTFHRCTNHMREEHKKPKNVTFETPFKIVIFKQFCIKSYRSPSSNKTLSNGSSNDLCLTKDPFKGGCFDVRSRSLSLFGAT